MGKSSDFIALTLEFSDWTASNVPELDFRTRRVNAEALVLDICAQRLREKANGNPT